MPGLQSVNNRAVDLTDAPESHLSEPEFITTRHDSHIRGSDDHAVAETAYQCQTEHGGRAGQAARATKQWRRSDHLQQRHGTTRTVLLRCCARVSELVMGYGGGDDVQL